jgi:hypothetical protein
MQANYQGNMTNGQVPYNNPYGQTQGQPIYMPPNAYQPTPVMPGFVPVMPVGYFGIQPRMLGLDKLMAIRGVFIKSKFRGLEALTGCEQTHRHFVYALGADGKAKKGHKVFKCKEASDCLMRQCCSPHCRAFNMDVTHKDYQDSTFDGEPFLKFERPFQCTFLCLARPEMTVSLTEQGQSAVLGKIVNPFQCCDLTVHIKDAQDNLRYKIVGSCCQCGVLCEGPCCQGAEFDILTATGEKIGALKRVRASILQNMVETVANFSVEFPPQSTGPDRALFIAAAIMLDFTYFEKSTKGAAQTAAELETGN